MFMYIISNHVVVSATLEYEKNGMCCMCTVFPLNQTEVNSLLSKYKHGLEQCNL